MTPAFVIRTFFELTAAILLIWGFINEKKVIDFEHKLFRAIAIHYRNRRRRKLAEQMKKLGVPQCRMPAEAERATENPAESKPKKVPGRVA